MWDAPAGAVPRHRSVVKTLRSYWQLSRTPRYSILFALPLLALYEGLAALLSGGEGVRNGADVMLKSAFATVAGAWGPIVFGVTLLAGCLWLVGRDLKRLGGLRRGIAKLEGRVFAGMLGESAALALVFGGAVALVTAQLLRPFASVADVGAGSAATLVALAAQSPLEELSWPVKLMVSLGAGLYEELLFRVVLVGGLALLARHVFAFGPRASAVIAVLGGAFLFSAFHYVGAYGDAFTVASFTFRLVAGVFFSGLFLLRGFGITAWTHALYDVFLLVV